MRNYLSTCLILFCALSAFSCAEKELPNQELTFILLVDNPTTKTVDIYLNSVLDQDGFILSGTAFSNETLEIPNLVVGSQYIMRVVNSGRPDGEFFEERSFANLEPEVESITLTIPE